MCALVAAYMVLGAFVFSALEAESQMKEAELARDLRARFAKELWNVTLHTNVIYDVPWRKETNRLVIRFQASYNDNLPAKLFEVNFELF